MRDYSARTERGKASAAVEFGAKIVLSRIQGYTVLKELSWVGYSEATLLKVKIELNKENTGHCPEALLADKSYRYHDNLTYCRDRNIRLSGPCLGRLSKDRILNKIQERKDRMMRNEIEGSFGVWKRRYSLARIVAKFAGTSESFIALKKLVMIFKKMLRDVLSFWYTGILLTSMAFRSGAFKNLNFSGNEKNKILLSEVLMISRAIKPIKQLIRTACLIFPFVIATSMAFALHPLITEDTGTQGKGKFELEFGFNYERDNYLWKRMSAESALNNEQGKGSARDRLYECATTITYGLIDSMDIDIGIPVQHVRSTEKGIYSPYDPAAAAPSFSYLSEPRRSKSSVGGISDTTVNLKWKFLELGVASFALKPGVIFPTGNEDDGLGAGLFGVQGFMVGTIELSPVIIHINLGYIRNSNNQNEREDLWHVSAAMELWVIKEYLRLVGNIGLERNPDKQSKLQDAHILGGIVFSPTPNVDLDLGFKSSLAPAGSESPGADYSILGGMTIRF